MTLQCCILFHSGLFSVCTLLCVRLFMLCSFNLFPFHVALFPYSHLFKFNSFHDALFHDWTFFIQWSFHIANFCAAFISCCTSLRLHHFRLDFFHIVLFFMLYSFHSSVFSCNTFLLCCNFVVVAFFVYYPFFLLHVFMLYSFHKLDFFMLRLDCVVLFFFDNFFFNFYQIYKRNR